MTLHVGHAMDELRKLPDESVHCCVTSPPYFNLRDYGLEPTVWGGDPDCEHTWGDRITIHKGGPTGSTCQAKNRAANESRDAVKSMNAGQFCECGAWLGCLGLEPDYQLFVNHIAEVFEEVRRVLRSDGTLWLNMGDSYATNTNSGLKHKDLMGQPWRCALALQEMGWWLRADIIWHKPTAMPETVSDRTTRAHEYIFLLTKNERYFYDAEAIKEPASPNTHSRGTGQNPKSRIPSGWDTGEGNHHGLTGRYKSRQNPSFSKAVSEVVADRNKRSVWKVASVPFKRAHFATFPPKLIEPCILAGCPAGGVVLDPFMGSGTTAMVAQQLGRQWIGIEQNPEYAEMIAERTAQKVLPFTED